MKALLTVLAVAVMSAALPSAVYAWQVEIPAGVLSFTSDNQMVTHCELLRDGSGACEADGDGAHFTLSGSMDLQLLAEGELQIDGSGKVVEASGAPVDVVGVLVGCKICLDGSCPAGDPADAAGNPREAGPAYSYAPLAEAGTFETFFFINGATGTDRENGIQPGPEAYNSYYCGLWLHATLDGTDLLVMPSEFYDPTEALTRFAKTEGSPVAELTGPLR